MRFHLIGLNHLPVLKMIQPCAFTQKVWKMAKMLMDLGHEVYLYGAGSCDAPCTEFIQVITQEDLDENFGKYDWRKEMFRTDFANEKPSSRKFITNTIKAINKRKRPDDFLLLSMGTGQKEISDVVNLYLTVEYGIGYRGSFAKFRAFESYSLRNYQYGVENHTRGDTCDGKYYDRIIPNYFDPEMFKVMEPCREEPYVCYVGRMIYRKGISIAYEAAKRAGVKLIMAGQGGEWQEERGVLKCDDTELLIHDNLKYLGSVDAIGRNHLMGKAMATLVPTIYMEPFGGVNVESQLCGTPAITSNFGAFPETVLHGQTGYICHTLQDFVTAIRNCMNGNVWTPEKIRQHASKYLMHNVALEFQRWFEDLYEVYLSTIGKSYGWSQVDDVRPSDKIEATNEWEEAQVWEKNWWATNTGNFINTFDEERKQVDYAPYLGLKQIDDIGVWFELEPATRVLDLGSNAVSLLMKCRNHEGSWVVDPIAIPDWAIARYEQAGISYHQCAAEDLLDNEDFADKTFDEVWIYNLLQHVRDPRKVISVAKSYASKIRVFEWINLKPSAGHPHTFTQAALNNAFGVEGNVGRYVPKDSYGCAGDVWYGVFNY